MKKFNKKIVTTLVIASFMLGFVGLNTAQAATSPTLGAAESFSVIAQTLITGIATIFGDVGMNNTGENITGLTTAMVTPGTIYATSIAGPSEGIIDSNVQANLSTAYDFLNTGGDNASCIKASTGLTGTDTGVIELGGKSLPPGVYCTDGSYAIAGASTLTLLGTTGTWIFKTATGLTTGVSSSVVGGDPCNVWWRVGSAAAGLGDASTFIGTIIAYTGITFGTNVTLNGRALAVGAAVTLNSGGTISGCAAPTPATLNVIKHVSGGTASADDWLLTVSSSNSGIGTGSAAGSVGTLYTLQTGKAYGVTESNGPSSYVATSAGCTIASAVAGTPYTCTITNTYHAPSSGSSVIYGCKDPTATNYNYFSTSNPELCTYASVVAVVTPTPVITSTPVAIVPKLPKTGFPPEEVNSSWYSVLFSSILNLFR